MKTIPPEIEEDLRFAPDLPRFSQKQINLTDWLVAKRPHLSRQDASAMIFLYQLNRKNISRQICIRAFSLREFQPKLLIEKSDQKFEDLILLNLNG